MDSEKCADIREVILTIFLFVLCFIVTEVILSHFYFLGVYRRFIFRITFLIQYSLLIYLLLDYRDTHGGNISGDSLTTEPGSAPIAGPQNENEKGNSNE